MTEADPIIPPPSDPPPAPVDEQMRIFSSPVIDRIRSRGHVWPLPGGDILLPRVFGFCRGVKRALAMLGRACEAHAAAGKRLFLLGQIIHNPWVNDHFLQRGVQLLTPRQVRDLASHVAPDDCAIIPAFGVLPEVERQLAKIGCEVVNTTCGDVRRLWLWAERAAGEGYAVLIFGRAGHDETVVTKRRLAEAGGTFLVVGNLDEARRFARWVAGEDTDRPVPKEFGPEQTNATSASPLQRLAQVSQTTMLYDETMAVRSVLSEAFTQHWGEQEAGDRLRFQPTVCRATQDRQAAAVELCRRQLDLAVVVGGFTSSNTTHLFELARQFAPAVFIEDARGILTDRHVRTFDPDRQRATVRTDWLPRDRPLRIGVLAGASSPEIVIGEVLETLASFLR